VCVRACVCVCVCVCMRLAVKKTADKQRKLVQLRQPVRKHVRNIVLSELDFNKQRAEREMGRALACGFHTFGVRLNNGMITIPEASGTGYSRWTDSILNRLSSNVPSISN